MMNTSVITFQANEQSLVKSGGISEYASSTAGYVLVTFALGTNWTSGYDVVSAYFRQGTRIIPMVLNHQGQCFVPPELLKATGKIFVNLSGSVVVNNTLEERLTTFPVEALDVTKRAYTDGAEPVLTPSQIEQFAALVKEDADRAEESSLKSEGFAVGEQEGEPVTSGSDYFENNAKYYAGEASDSAGDAADSEANALIYKGAAEDAKVAAEAARGTAETQALKSEGYAVGRQNGQFVPSGSTYYKNNAKYYSEEAGDSARGAADSEANAYIYKGDAENAQVAAETAQGKAEDAEDGAEAQALKAEGFAVGEQNGTPVSSGSPYYENNAEYFKDQAWAAVAALDIGLSVVNGELNITYTEA